MIDHVARLYALALALVVFLVAWAAVAANPFPQANPTAIRGLSHSRSGRHGSRESRSE